MYSALARLFLPIGILLLGLPGLPIAAQDNFVDVIEISVEVGFDSFFRPGDWTPVQAQLKNNGESLLGRLVVRPETSGTVVGNAFSTPVELPSGSEKTAQFNIRARSFPDKIRVELIDADGVVRASREAGLIDLAPQDQIYAVVAGPNTTPPSLSGVHIGGYDAEQAIWGIHDIPENGAALESLDMMMFIGANSEALSSGQRRAIREWLHDGGHLLLAGGPTAASTTAAFSDLLPLELDDSQAIDGLTALARFAGDWRRDLNERTIIASGNRREGAEVLAEQAGQPLLLRRYIGAGLVDYLAADPTLQPLASWEALGDLWLKVLATRAPHPVWREGFTRPEWGAEAVANLPGVDLLPPMQTLCLFLTAYIVLIGPLNYLLLSKLRRNGWGWLTIPIVIALFTGVAWTVGFSLRGAEIIVSRLTVVESFADSDEAEMNQFVGLLSPRRATYSLAAPEGYTLAVAGATTPSSIFASNTIQTATEVSQGAIFSAQDFTIDGGIFANFTVSGQVERPAIRGAFKREFDILESGRMLGAFQGVISNDSDVTLRDAVLLGTGLVYRLEGDFAPGDILTLGREELESDLSDEPAQPNPDELSVSSVAAGLSPFTGSGRNVSIRDLQGARYLRTRAFLRAQSIAERQAVREQSFLASFMVDQFESTARGTSLYLLGWSDAWGRDLEISGAGWSSVDTTLYIIELEVETELPRGRATLPSEYFTWMTLDRQGLTDNGTDSFSLFEEQGAEFIFHPQPGLEMDVVDFMQVEVDRGGGYAQSLSIDLYDWRRGEYEIFSYREGDVLELSNPRRFLGPGQAVRLRLHYGDGVGTARVRKIRIDQTGRYT